MGDPRISNQYQHLPVEFLGQSSSGSNNDQCDPASHNGSVDAWGTPIGSQNLISRVSYTPATAQSYVGNHDSAVPGFDDAGPLTDVRLVEPWSHPGNGYCHPEPVEEFLNTMDYQENDQHQLSLPSAMDWASASGERPQIPPTARLSSPYGQYQSQEAYQPLQNTDWDIAAGLPQIDQQGLAMTPAIGSFDHPQQDPMETHSDLPFNSQLPFRVRLSQMDPTFVDQDDGLSTDRVMDYSLPDSWSIFNTRLLGRPTSPEQISMFNDMNMSDPEPTDQEIEDHHGVVQDSNSEMSPTAFSQYVDAVTSRTPALSGNVAGIQHISQSSSANVYPSAQGPAGSPDVAASRFECYVKEGTPVPDVAIGQTPEPFNPVYQAHRLLAPSREPSYSGDSSQTSSPGAWSLTSSTEPTIVICDNCDATFSGIYRKGNLGRHKRQVHGGKPLISCEHLRCNRSFKRSDARLKHYRRHHPELARSAHRARR